MIDFYELTMGQGYFDEKKHETQSCFDLFFRKCPDGASFVIANGVDACVDFVKNFHFEKEDIDYLRSLNKFSEDYLDYLSNLKFTGDIYAVKDGTIVFPHEPVITVKAPLIQAQLIETGLLLLFNRSSLITTKASRIVRAAKGRGVMEFGSRRAQGFSAANDGALDAYIAGAIGTACTVSGRDYGVPVLGTMAHSFVQSFDSEYEAFCAYCRAFPDNATLLVDTYDTLRSGIPNAIKAYNDVLKPMGKRLAGIRIDSGDLAYLTKMARVMLDKAKLCDAKICVSNSLDEELIENLLLQGAPIDSFGVGENLITAKSSPVFGGVYKLSAIEKNGELIPKIKISDNVEKTTNPGFKDIVRLYDQNGKIITDVITLFGEEFPKDIYTLIDTNNSYVTKQISNYTIRHIRDKVVENGDDISQKRSVLEKRDYVQKELATLWEENLRLKNPQTFIINLSPKLAKTKEKLIQEHIANKTPKIVKKFEKKEKIDENSRKI